MKFNLNKGIVTLTSETQEESLMLFRVATKTTDVFAPQLKRKPHKKHNFVKKCELCGKGYKGSIGLGVHQSRCKRITSADTFNKIWKLPSATPEN